MRKKRTAVILALVLIGCAAMSFVDGILRPGYAIKSLIKAAVFTVLPLLYALLDKESGFSGLFRFRKNGIIRFLSLGAVVYLFILGCYILLRPFIDFSNITAALTGNTGVNKDNFLLVSIYISFINSFLEEFFFRGFAFLTLKKTAGKTASYLVSASAFSLYHIAMMQSWFSAGMYILLIAGLFLSGLIFNRLDENDGNIYPSWAIHMFANFSINTIGFLLFGIL